METCCVAERNFSWSREASGFFLELLDLATSSATPESEEMDAVIQDTSEKKFQKASDWERGRWSRVRLLKRKDPSLLIYSLLERVGSLLRGWWFLNQSKQQYWQAKILLS